MRLSKFLVPLSSVLFLAAPFVAFADEEAFVPTEIVIDGMSGDSSDSGFAFASEAPAANVMVGEGTVMESMRAAINYAPSLKAIRESRTAAQYELGVSMGNYLPTIDVMGSVGYGLTSNVSSRLQGIDKKFYPNVTATATATQILFSGFGITNTVDYNEYRVISMDHRVFDNATSLALEALIAHSEVIRLRELLEVTADYVDTHLLIISQLELLVTSGINTTSDVSQAQGRLVNAQVSYQNVQNALEVALVNYRKITGFDAPEVLISADLPLNEIADVDSILSDALVYNPKILALQADLEAAAEQSAVAASGYYPTISLDLQALYENDQLTASPNQETYTFNGSIGGSWNIFDGFATENSRRAANAYERVAQQTLSDMVDTVTSEVKTTYEDYLVAENLRLSYSQALLYNSATRDSYMSQFRFGTRPLLDLLDAESELYGTQVQLGIMSSNRVVGAWRLLALQGNMLEELGVDANAFITDEYNSPIEEIEFSF